MVDLSIARAARVYWTASLEARQALRQGDAARAALFVEALAGAADGMARSGLWPDCVTRRFRDAVDELGARHIVATLSGGRR